MSGSHASALRSFQDTKLSELRIRCTMQICPVVCGKTAPIASGKPFSPSITASILSQNLAPSVCSSCPARTG